MLATFEYTIRMEGQSTSGFEQQSFAEARQSDMALAGATEEAGWLESLLVEDEHMADLPVEPQLGATRLRADLDQLCDSFVANKNSLTVIQIILRSWWIG